MLHMRFAIWCLVCILVMSSSVAASMRSTTNSIQFDSNSDGYHEATLNTTGLGIGTTPSSNLHVIGNAICNSLTVGASSIPSANLDLNGAMGFSFQQFTTSGNIDSHSMVLADSSADNLSLYLPSPASCSGRKYTIKKTSQLNSLWVSSANRIDTYSSVELQASSSIFPYLTVMSDGADWNILNASGLTGETAAANLVAWYKLDESSGTTISDTFNGEDGTLTDPSGNTSVTSGVVGLSRDFDGTDAGYAINLPSSSALSDLQNGSYSVSAWYYPNALPYNTGTNDDRHAIVMLAGYHRGLSYRATGAFSCQHYGVGGNVLFATSTSTFAPSSWYHVTGTIDAENEVTKLYVNGSLEKTYSWSANNSSYTNAANWRIGAALTVTSYKSPANGRIDEVRLYDHILSADEIEAIYRNR
ncbi:MAG: LamG domain-containing protein [Planctomycetes bacterium]|nr:LamG domain-containing protein [Planctomycetota bacterium]